MISHLIETYNNLIYSIQQVIYQPAARRSAAAGVSAGFTIVELLIVIVVIGILAAIVIVAFNGVQNQAYNTTIESDMASFHKKYESLKIMSSDGLYPSPTGLTAADGLKLSKSAYEMDRNNGYFCTNSDRTAYGLGIVSKGGTSYYLQGPEGRVTKEPVSDSIVRTTKMGPTGAICNAALAHNPPGTINSWRAWVN